VAAASAAADMAQFAYPAQSAGLHCERASARYELPALTEFMTFAQEMIYGVSNATDG
jgi:hypothetical protein